MVNWFGLWTDLPIGIRWLVQDKIETERYYLQLLALGWSEQNWKALLSWIKEHDLPFFATLDWAKRATAFGIPLPEGSDIDKWQEKVREEHIKRKLGINK